MLKKCLEKLDRWMGEENREREASGAMPLKKARVRVLGQMALLEAKLDLELAATADVDAYLEAEGSVRLEFARILREEGLQLDPDSEKVWMPKETKYEAFFKGAMVTAELAQVEFVMLSKALKAPKKNGAILTQYLAEAAGEEFLELAKKYDLDLEQFL